MKSDSSKAPPARTLSGLPVKPVYRPEDVAGLDYRQALGDPGEFPFARGIHPLMYRARPWSVRQYAGFGASEDANERFRFLLAHGQQSLSIALDLPTQLGFDSDDPHSLGEVGRVGVAVDTLEDLERVFDGIPINEVSVSFTVNATAPIILAMFVALAQKRGVPLAELKGTVQNDILKEYMARGTYIFPPRPSIRLTGDIIEYCLQHLPKFNAISVACHFQQTGATPLETWGYQILNARVYVDEVVRRGYTPDQFADNISFLTTATMDFFESVCKTRAARRIWAHIMKDEYQAKTPKAMAMKVAASSQGRSLTAQQPLNNISRITLMALASVLGGPQTMLLTSYDEAYDIPSEEAARTSLMIQQILRHESNVMCTADPLAGSWFIESLTNDCEQKIREVMADVNARGGIVHLVETGQIMREMAAAAYQEELAVQRGEKVVVGLNKYVIEEDRRMHESVMYTADPEAEARQIERLRAVRARRDDARVRATLAGLEAAVAREDNLMVPILEAVQAYATVGEIVRVMERVYGRAHFS